MQKTEVPSGRDYSGTEPGQMDQAIGDLEHARCDRERGFYDQVGCSAQQPPRKWALQHKDTLSPIFCRSWRNGFRSFIR